MLQELQASDDATDCKRARKQPETNPKAKAKAKGKAKKVSEAVPDESQMRDRIRPKSSDSCVHSMCKIMLSKLSEEDFIALHTNMKKIGLLLFASACSGMETPLIALWVLYSILFPLPNPPCSSKPLYACEKENSKISWENFVHGCCHHNSEPQETLCVLKDMAGP